MTRLTQSRLSAMCEALTERLAGEIEGIGLEPVESYEAALDWVRERLDRIPPESKEELRLTAAEIRAALEAINQMTDGNANDFDEWQSQTSGSREEWKALLRAETKLQKLLSAKLKPTD